jgi:hypothetical protein
MLLAALAAVALRAQDPGPPEVVGPALPDPAAEALLDFLRPLAQGELPARFAEIAARFPEHAGLERLPLDEAGGEAVLLVLGTRAGGPEHRPGLLFYGWGDLDSASTALALAQECLAPEASAGGAPAELLGRVTLYLLPELAEEQGAAELIAARNFPIGWRPHTVVPGAGSVPLAAPAARLLARFLQTRANVSLAVELGEAPCTGPEPADVDGAAYRREFAALAALAEAGGAHLQTTSLCPGTAPSFAWAARGIFPARLVTPELLDPLERALALLRARGLLSAAEALPALALAEPAVEVLRPGQVRIDVRLENRGRLPTQSAMGAERHLAAPVELTVSGGRVLACAAGPGPLDLAVRPATGATYRLGEIAAGGGLDLSLFVEAPPESELILTCSSPRAGSAERRVSVP